MAVGESRIEGLLEGEDVLATADGAARHGRRARARRRRQLARLGRGRRRPRRARRRARPGQCRHRRPAADGPARRARLHQLSHRRRLAALAADAAGDRAAEPDGRHLPRPQRRPAAAGADRPDRSPADRLREPGRLGPGQVGRAAGRAARARAPRPWSSRWRRATTASGCWRRWAPRSTVETADGGGRRVTIAGQPELRPQSFVVPGDPSSAGVSRRRGGRGAGLAVRLRGVGLNPLRTGLYTTLREMGADIAVEDERVAGGEPVGDLVIRGGDADAASRCRRSARPR